MFYKIMIITVFIFYSIVSLVIAGKKKKLFTVLFINSGFGVLSLVMLHLFSGFLNFTVCINTVSVFLSLTLGPIGTILFTVINIIFL